MVAVAASAACKETPTAGGPDAQAASSKPASTMSAAPSATVTTSATAAPTASDPAPTRIAAQHLLVAWKGAASAPKDVTRTKDQAKKRAEEAAKRAKAGEDFSALVTEYSDDPTKADRGNLGMFTRESKVKPFADAAFALPAGGVSEVVETRFGYHVIKRNQ